MFANGSHFQITGGQFINVGRDINFESVQAAGNLPDVLPALDFQHAGRPLGGAERTERGASPRMLPYDISQRRHFIAHPNNIDTQGSSSTAASYFDAPPYGRDPRLQLYQRLTSDGRNNENWTWSSYPVGIANGRATDWHPDFEQIPSGPVVNTPPSLHPASASLAQNAEQHVPWNHLPTTNITGGTFIGGNMNRIERHGETGLHILARTIAGIRQSISGSSFNPLDQLYLQILSGVPEDFHPQLLEILMFLEEFLSLEQIGYLLGIRTSELRLILRGLHSVINVPEHDLGMHLLAHHASFLDFLNDPSRSGPFHIGSPQCGADLAVQLLKTLSSNVDLTTILPREIPRIALDLIASADPSPDFLPLVQSLNPDFVFLGDKEKSVASFLSWLKKFTPPPQNLIDIWEDYAFMSMCDRLWVAETRNFFVSTEALSNNRPSIVSPVSFDRNSLRILYAYKVIANTPQEGNYLFKTRYLLGLSWDELRAAICRLRGILGRDITQLMDHRTWTLDERVLAPFDMDSVLAELAKSCLCHIRATMRGQIDLMVLCEIVPNWGCFVRACPPSPELLNDLSEFARASDGEIDSLSSHTDLYDVVQWLKTFHPIPVELVNRFEDLLEDYLLHDGWDTRDSMENDWMEWWEMCQEYGKHLTIR
ncbi:Nwd2 [Mycena sanguinolenta]|uniref:Nwd2 n=1 Tax=Mycena sanguinolenta TaxID=230812 RepID=A0A8H6ZLA1_9AGAR|nr:Nwd2 [Mycena sanguinolenta]